VIREDRDKLRARSGWTLLRRLDEARRYGDERLALEIFALLAAREAFGKVTPR